MTGSQFLISGSIRLLRKYDQITGEGLIGDPRAIDTHSYYPGVEDWVNCNVIRRNGGIIVL